MSASAASPATATSSPDASTICIIGHATKDVITIPGRPVKVQAGGTVHYAAAALQSLGAQVSVVTRVAPQDDQLLNEMRSAGIRVHAIASKTSTVFDNRYEGADLAVRHQKVEAVAESFLPEHVAVAEKAKVYQLGPLTANEMSAEFIAAVAKQGGLLGMDVQGFTRVIKDQRVKLGSCANLRDLLQHVQVIKADDNEALVLTGEKTVESAARALAAMGPKEICITFADRGSLILDRHGKFHSIPAYPPKQTTDATGCGDTYFASYLYRRMFTEDAEEAGRFASAAASLKLENDGPFRGSVAEVYARAGIKHS
jgi:sugar/nucleoside kinase (ribokinase family)